MIASVDGCHCYQLMVCRYTSLGYSTAITKRIFCDHIVVIATTRRLPFYHKAASATARRVPQFLWYDCQSCYCIWLLQLHDGACSQCCQLVLISHQMVASVTRGLSLLPRDGYQNYEMFATCTISFPQLHTSQFPQFLDGCHNYPSTRCSSQLPIGCTKLPNGFHLYPHQMVTTVNSQLYTAPRQWSKLPDGCNKYLKFAIVTRRLPQILGGCHRQICNSYLKNASISVRWLYSQYLVAKAPNIGTAVARWLSQLPGGCRSYKMALKTN